MDLCNANVPDTEPIFPQMFLAAQQQAVDTARAQNADPIAAAAPVDPEPVRRARIEILRNEHRTRFPLSPNLYALIMIVLADLDETQSERMMTVPQEH